MWSIYAATLQVEFSAQHKLWFIVYLYFKTLHFYLIYCFKFLPLPSAYTTLPQISLPSMTDIDGQPLEGQFQPLHSSTGDREDRERKEHQKQESRKEKLWQNK